MQLKTKIVLLILLITLLAVIAVWLYFDLRIERLEPQKHTSLTAFKNTPFNNTYRSAALPYKPAY